MLEQAKEDRRKRQSDIDLFKGIKYVQGYKDHDQGKDPQYPLEDDEEEPSRDEMEGAECDGEDVEAK